MAIADRENREALIQVLEACGLAPFPCSTLGEVRAILAVEAKDIVFCDVAFAHDCFDDLPRTFSSGEVIAPVVVCSRLYDRAVYLDVMNRGAFDFMAYPYRTDDVKWIVGTALRKYPGRAMGSQKESRRATSAKRSGHASN